MTAQTLRQWWRFNKKFGDKYEIGCVVEPPSISTRTLEKGLAKVGWSWCVSISTRFTDPIEAIAQQPGKRSRRASDHCTTGRIICTPRPGESESDIGHPFYHSSVFIAMHGLITLQLVP